MRDDRNQKKLLVIEACKNKLVGQNVRACNLFVQSVANELIGPQSGMSNKNANDQVIYMRAKWDWETLGEGDVGAMLALTAANRGKLVIAGWRNPTGPHGHVAVVVADGWVKRWPRGYWGQFPNGPGGQGQCLRESFGAEIRPATEFFCHEF